MNMKRWRWLLVAIALLLILCAWQRMSSSKTKRTDGDFYGPDINPQTGAYVPPGPGADAGASSGTAAGSLVADQLKFMN